MLGIKVLMITNKSMVSLARPIVLPLIAAIQPKKTLSEDGVVIPRGPTD